MKTLELADLLYSLGDDCPEIYIEDADGYTHEITFDERDEQFDGWDTVYPKYIALKMKSE